MNKAERRGTRSSGDDETQTKTEGTGTDLNAFTALWTTVSGFESLPPSQVRNPGRHLTQHQDSQALRRREHPFADENILLSAQSGFSGCFTENSIRSAVDQCGRVTLSSAMSIGSRPQTTAGGCSSISGVLAVQGTSIKTLPGRHVPRTARSSLTHR